MRMSFITKEVGNGLRRNFTMTVALIVSVAVSLSLVGAALLMSAQVDRMKGYWYDKIEVSIFLCGKSSVAFTCTGTVTPSQRTNIESILGSLSPTVQDVFYESSADAYKQFKEQFAGSAILANISPDALPESFRVKLDDPANFEKVASALQSVQGVESIQDQRKLLDRFFQILRGLQTFALAVALAMLFVTILLVMNTVRVAAFARRRETSIMRSVGASNMAIRLPFILEAAVAAILGSTLATAGILAAKYWVIDARLAPNLTFIPFVTWPEVLVIIPWLYLIGVGTTVLASSITLRRYLKG
ncbi:MAG: FtsX-like permease family protein [Actinobacteria bacterium]|nr:FtsX-like permease family protein [Actinomycetota bacterium]MSW25233.1 FtsX-like permease family protein [Actinomycetota bacterium]MSX29267.1 FtsX-like permease family protein [Actinomycetota bacterium]MSX42922.1 FtsX-like permease family protein [Actinomycetota bacterium]MSX96897.1 FtsX-like permease family protein [Actinomycetota bacterium]